ncbi:hypothetical protein LSH36_405g02065 [Paralvinella palmiformis]|uniref:Carboxypeptidase Q n=1 Tax=Paralvinella palmiformis TaxID=53620 RepID=A0AAD9JCP9_9ANNE|nr:hypothetical protein LSH36_405g02065 [Paralvinella palmiformis]
MNLQILEDTRNERDLGVYIDEELKFHDHVSKAVAKASRLLGLIRATFTFLDNVAMPRLFTIMVRPHLEYECVVILSVLLTATLCQDFLSTELKQEILDHKANVDRIINYVLRGPGKHQAMRRLENLTDDFGPRSTGSEALDYAIDYVIDNLIQEGFTNVAGEDVTAPKWTRNEEELFMIKPRYHRLSLMSLGSSVGTNGVLEREVIVVRNFDELDAKANENSDIFKDKIVLYNQIWITYPETVQYRVSGAWRAAKYGAVAALVSSVTDFSLYTPHTGIQIYNPNVTDIPVATITVEDANQMQRYYDKGVKIVVKLNMTCKNHGDIITRNVVAELGGSSKPNEVVIFGGHIDSWDVGYGVMDDGGGVAITWQALNILKELNLIPKRTLRAVFWTSEEIGLVGAKQYYQRHKDENGNISLVMESDYGTFKPFGVGFTGSDTARAIIKEIVAMLETINTTGVDTTGESPDTDMWIAAGVPGVNLWNANDKYFYYHHSNGDSIIMQNPDDLDLCVIVWTVVAYVVANLEDKLPRLDITSTASLIMTHNDTRILFIVGLLSLCILKRLR